MAESSTSVCNMALKRHGAQRIANYEDNSDTKPEAIYCRLFFEQTAKALMKDHYWPFAKDRVQLSQDPATPAFQWSYAFLLPNDFLRLIVFYNGADNPTGRTEYSFEIEGGKLLTGESACYLRYIRWVPDVGSWDPLFIECFVLALAKKLSMALAQDPKIGVSLDNDLIPLMRKVRALDRQEELVVGRADLRTWRDARYSDTA